MDQSLKREDWLRAARLALLRRGPEAVRVEKLARALRVTKGSFYWHFNTRDELLEILLEEWEQELPDLLARMKGHTRRDALQLLFNYMLKTTELSERGEAPSDAAIFSWASVSPAVRARVNAVEKERIAALKRLAGRDDRVEVVHLMWLGFVARGQRLPESRQRFPHIARTMLKLLLAPDTRRSPRNETSRRRLGQAPRSLRGEG
jgi:AcrR family transcriptional regulator